MLNALFISSIRYWINLLTGSLIFSFNFALIGKCLEFDNSRTCQSTSIILCFEIRSSDALLPGDPECSDPRYVSHDLWTADTCREGSPPHSLLSPAQCAWGGAHLQRWGWRRRSGSCIVPAGHVCLLSIPAVLASIVVLLFTWFTLHSVLSTIV